MGLPEILQQIAEGFHEHELMKALGPDYRQKRAQQAATLTGTNLDNSLNQEKLTGLQEGSQAEQDLAASQFPGAPDSLRQYKAGRLGKQQTMDEMLQQATIAQHIAPLLKVEQTPKGHYDPARGVLVDEMTGHYSPVTGADGKALPPVPDKPQIQMVQMQDPNNPLRQVWQAVDKRQALKNGTTYSKGFGQTLMDRFAQAGTVHDQADVVLHHLQSPSLLSKIGPAIGRYGKIELAIGDSDPELSGFAMDLASLKAALPALHRFKGGPQVIAHFDQAMGDIARNPAALISTVQSTKAFARMAAINDIGGGSLASDPGVVGARAGADPVLNAPNSPMPTPAPSSSNRPRILSMQQVE